MLEDWMKVQENKVAALQKREDAYYGAIAGGYTYFFTPTTLGTVAKVINNLTKEEIDLTDYDKW